MKLHKEKRRLKGIVKHRYRTKISNGMQVCVGISEDMSKIMKFYQTKDGVSS